MKKLTNNEAELKKTVTYKKTCIFPEPFLTLQIFQQTSSWC